LQTVVAQASQPFASLAPEVHGECAHEPPLDVLLLVDVVVVVLAVAVVLVLVVALELAAVLLPDMRLPQGSVTGMHTLTGLPSVVFTGVHAWPDGHACPPLQSVAQYVSPANCAQSRPAPQPSVVTQVMQSPPLLPPVPVTPPVPVVTPAPVVTLEPVSPPVPAVVEREPDVVVAPGPDVDASPPMPPL